MGGIVVDKARVLQSIYAVIDDLNQTRASSSALAKDPATALFGAQSVLDSLGLVNLIVGVEQRIADEQDAALRLQTEAPSATKFEVVAVAVYFPKLDPEYEGQQDTLVIKARLSTLALSGRTPEEAERLAQANGENAAGGAGGAGASPGGAAGGAAQGTGTR